jgi:hypothetical protein
VILGLAIVLSGCSVLKGKKTALVDSRKLSELAISDLENSNLTKNDFYIQKAEIYINNDGKQDKLLGNLKFRKSGTYLFSIRNITGIEAARILINNDSVFINDRINKKLYYGSSEDLNNKYGISFAMLPLIVGDYISYKAVENTKVECKNEKCTIEGSIRGKKILYEVDCSNSKVTNAIIYNDSDKEGLRLKMSEFVKNDSVCFPKIVAMEDLDKENKITIKINKIKFSEKEEINFIPGNKYEKILLK